MLALEPTPHTTARPSAHGTAARCQPADCPAGACASHGRHGSAAPARASNRGSAASDRRQRGHLDLAEPRDRLAVRALHRIGLCGPRRHQTARTSQAEPARLKREERVVDRAEARACGDQHGHTQAAAKSRMSKPGRRGTSNPPTPSTTSVWQRSPASRAAANSSPGSIGRPASSAARWGETGGSNPIAATAIGGDAGRCPEQLVVAWPVAVGRLREARDHRL